jgi:iron complex outermembrane receptor protein
MKPFTPRKLALAIAAQLALTAGFSPVVLAQEEDLLLEEVITVGTRGKPRSATDSPAPVDVFKASDFANQGDTDVNNLLPALCAQPTFAALLLTTH